MATGMEYVHLRDFSDAELIFDEAEKKDILKFFFQADQPQIQSVKITNELRNFAQGLLVAAVDASYAMGWIELTFRWVANPGPGMQRSLQKLAHRAAHYWFKNFKNKPLHELKIYERVRDRLANNFRSPFQIILQAKTQGTEKKLLAALVYCGAPNPHDKVWG